MTQISIDFNHVTGRIKPMHATGQPPFTGGFAKLNFLHIDYLKQANIPYSRLHDVGGAFGSNRYVDIPNIFRDFEADVNDPAAYDFAFTDALIAGMYEYGIEPIFRLGVTIENQCHIKAYRIHPPKDYRKWARVCEHIIRHYNEGWADGYRYGITYWEIWNEPDNGIGKFNQMWTGTAEQYYELYDVTAKHLKACFKDTIKVGGYGSSGMSGIYYDPEKYGVDVEKKPRDGRYEMDTYRVEFFLGFLEYIKAHNSPIDFFTWHSYAGVERTVVLSGFVQQKLREYGYGNLETHLNEWNNAHQREKLGKSVSSAQAAAMMCAMQNSETDVLCYYDSRFFASAYCGMFNAVMLEPYCTYYSFVAFGYLYKLGKQVECDWDQKGLYATAATNGEEKGVLITNTFEGDLDIQINMEGEFEVYLIDEQHMLKPVEYDARAFTLKQNQVVLLKGN